jgi:GH15 family glucan-1,4-alpha-glucosidase
MRGRGETHRQPSTGRRAPAHPRPRALYDYGLIGNMHTAALVSVFGSIDWACFPRFASPSLFARILDARNGGFQLLAPTHYSSSRQEYRPSTAILCTEFRVTPSRLLRVYDFMPVVAGDNGRQTPMVLRMAEAVGGAVNAVSVVDPRFDYARSRAKWRGAEDHWVARSGPSSLTVRTEWPMRPSLSGLKGTFTIPAGERRTIELIWGEKRPLADSPADLLESTERFWTNWVHSPSSTLHVIAGRWHGAIARSEVTLKLLSQRDTGAFIAAPTTSLPEWPGGTRNWDYRYVWVRDAAFAAQALLLLGHVTEARTFLHWILDRVAVRSGNPRLRVIYGVHGERRFTERELSHLAGFAGSRPVRVGNAAANQFQLDIYGELLDAALVLNDVESGALEAIWPAVESLADEVVVNWRRPDRGIWEVRGPPRHFVHSKVMAWVALDRAVRLGVEWSRRESVVRWEGERDRLRAVILARGFDPHRESFMQSFGSAEVDAANLRIPIVGFLDPDDPRVAGTVLQIERELSDGPFVYRYRGPDGLDGEEAAFLPCSFWLVDCLARAGERRRARENFEELLRSAGPLGLFSEEYDPAREMALGNYPQAFTHIALLRAALALGLAGAPRSVLDQYPWLVHATWRREAAAQRPIPLPGRKGIRLPWIP